MSLVFFTISHTNSISLSLSTSPSISSRLSRRPIYCLYLFFFLVLFNTTVFMSKTLTAVSLLRLFTHQVHRLVLLESSTSRMTAYTSKFQTHTRARVYNNWVCVYVCVRVCVCVRAFCVHIGVSGKISQIGLYPQWWKNLPGEGNERSVGGMKYSR